MDSNGNEIVGDAIDYKNVYEDRAAKIMTEVLTGVIKNGTGRGLGLSHTISAGKTGTTNDKKDGWFVGFTPYYTTSVWVGCDIPESISNLTGSSYPGTIWHNYMEQIHTSSMTKKFDYYDWRAEAKKAEEKLKQQLVTPTVSPDQTQFNNATPTEGTNSGDNQNTQDNTDISNNQDTSGSTSDNTDAGNESPVADNPADTTGSGSETNTDANSGTNSDGSGTGAGSSGTDSQSGQAGDNTAAAGNAGN
jgi:membrane peptidoglycan carboxypeptidase